MVTMKMTNGINDGNHIIQASIVGLVSARLCSTGFKHLDSFDPIITLFYKQINWGVDKLSN